MGNSKRKCVCADLCRQCHPIARYILPGPSCNLGTVDENTLSVARAYHQKHNLSFQNKGFTFKVEIEIN